MAELAGIVLIVLILVSLFFSVLGNIAAPVEGGVACDGGGG